MISILLTTFKLNVPCVASQPLTLTHTAQHIYRICLPHARTVDVDSEQPTAKRTPLNHISFRYFLFHYVFALCFCLTSSARKFINAMKRIARYFFFVIVIRFVVVFRFSCRCLAMHGAYRIRKMKLPFMKDVSVFSFISAKCLVWRNTRTKDAMDDERRSARLHEANEAW